MQDLTPTLTNNPQLYDLDAIFDKAQILLEQRLASDPKNVKTLRELGHIYRRKGDLVSTLKAYGQVLELLPNDDMTHYLYAVLSGQPFLNPIPHEEILPAPFVHLKDFVSETIHENLLNFVLAHKNEFMLSTVGDGLRTDIRFSASIPGQGFSDSDIGAEFLTHVKMRFQEVFSRLQISPFPVDFDLQITAHLDGHFYQIHKDSGDENGREISFVYYFHSTPKRFTGGDLLYDTDLENDGYARSLYTRVHPINNSIIFFPSQYFHEVTPVNCQTNSFEDGRFTFAGWLKPKK